MIAKFLVLNSVKDARRIITRSERKSDGTLLVSIPPSAAKRSVITVKGYLDNTSDYFFHALECQRKWDSRKGR